MKLSISNIGWNSDDDKAVYDMMIKYGYSGLEIAPTRILTEEPYKKLSDARKWYDNIHNKYGFVVPSMQSIWYGKKERLFGTDEERSILLDYTKQAINFAETIGCKNLVFGCPRNRQLTKASDADTAVTFFKELGQYALRHRTVLGLEANPPIYNTNYINDTLSALELIKNVDSDGFKLNLDIGTMIQNNENVNELTGNVKLINHVHISEPELKLIKANPIHGEIRKILESEDYQGFISIEMGMTDDLNNIETILRYIKEVFDERNDV